MMFTIVLLLIIGIAIGAAGVLMVQSMHLFAAPVPTTIPEKHW